MGALTLFGSCASDRMCDLDPVDEYLTPDFGARYRRVIEEARAVQSWTAGQELFQIRVVGIVIDGDTATAVDCDSDFSRRSTTGPIEDVASGEPVFARTTTRFVRSGRGPWQLESYSQQLLRSADECR